MCILFNIQLFYTFLAVKAANEMPRTILIYSSIDKLLL